jgi:hypothetical protein
MRLYMAEGDALAIEILPPPSPRKYRTRRGIAEWLVERLGEPTRNLVGIDHGLSFAMRYFEVNHLKPDWPAFLDDFQRHWPTDEDQTYVDFVRDGVSGDGAARMGQLSTKPADHENQRIVNRAEANPASRPPANPRACSPLRIRR